MEPGRALFRSTLAMEETSTLKLAEGRNRGRGQDEHPRQAGGPIEQRSGETPNRARKRDDREGKPSLD
jgi:hypothetical protein